MTSEVAAKGIDPKIEKLVLFLAASAAPILALTTSTWSESGGFVRDFMRLFSTPVTIIEMLVVLIGVREGFGFSKSWAMLGRVNQAVLGVLIMIAVGTAATAYADPVSAYIRTFNWIVHLLFGFTIAQMALQSRTPDLARKASVFVLFGLLAWLVGLLAFVLLITDPKQFSWMDFRFGVGNVRQLGFYGTVGYCLSIGLAVSTQEPRIAKLACVCGSLFMALLCWAAVRSGIVGVGLALMVGALAVSTLRTFKAFLTVGVSLMMAIPMAIFAGSPDPSLMGFWRLFGVTPAAGAEAFTSGRWEIWRGTIREMMERPFFGFGESQFRLLVPENHGIVYHPHNIELQVVFSWGLMGTVCFFYLFFKGLRSVVQSMSRSLSQVLGFGLTAIGLFGFAQLEGAMYHTWPVMILTTCLALALGLQTNDVGNNSQFFAEGTKLK